MSVVAVIDDDDDLRELMVMKLRALGLEVSEEANGLDGLRLVQVLKPDLVVVDWMMPGLTGIEVCRDIRNDPDTADIPVLMVSSRNQQSDAVVSRAAGATRFLLKPFRLSEFAEAANDLISGPKA